MTPQEYIDHHGITIRELAEELGVSKTTAHSLFTGQASDETRRRFGGIEQHPPVDSWTDEHRRTLRVIFDKAAVGSLYRWTCMHDDAIAAACEPSTKVLRHHRRLLRTFVDPFIALGGRHAL